MSNLQRSRWDLKQLLQVAFDTKRKNNQFLLSIIIDIIKSSFLYDMAYKEYRIYEFYKLTNSERRQFLMMSDAIRINKRYNQGINREIFTDKLKFGNRFKDYSKGKVLDLRVSGGARFADFVAGGGKFVAKQLQDNNGVFIFEIDEETKLDMVRAKLIKEAYYLLEPFISQHSALETLYPDCVNTLRVLTFVKEDLSVVVLNVALKLGNGGIRDNFSRGGLFSVLDETGTVIRPFVNKMGSIYEVHPVTNEALVGFAVPFYEEAITLCKNAALEIAGIRYVGWDVAITESGPVLVDGSLESKFFQTPPSVSAFVGEVTHDLRGTYAEHMDLSRHIKKNKKRTNV